MRQVCVESPRVELVLDSPSAVRTSPARHYVPPLVDTEGISDANTAIVSALLVKSRQFTITLHRSPHIIKSPTYLLGLCLALTAAHQKGRAADGSSRLVAYEISDSPSEPNDRSRAL